MTTFNERGGPACLGPEGLRALNVPCPVESALHCNAMQCNACSPENDIHMQVWADLYGLPVAGCEGKTAAQIFEAAGCTTPAAPSCAACLGGPKDTFARMNEPQVCVSTTNR